MDELERRLRAIDGRGYKAYKDIGGAWTFPDFTLHVEHVQGDPFADPSRVRVVLAPDVTGLPPATLCWVVARRHLPAIGKRQRTRQNHQSVHYSQ